MKSQFLFYCLLFLLAAIVYRVESVGEITPDTGFLCYIGFALAAVLSAFRRV